MTYGAPGCCMGMYVHVCMYTTLSAECYGPSRMHVLQWQSVAAIWYSAAWRRQLAYVHTDRAFPRSPLSRHNSRTAPIYILPLKRSPARRGPVPSIRPSQIREWLRRVVPRMTEIYLHI